MSKRARKNRQEAAARGGPAAAPASLSGSASRAAPLGRAPDVPWGFAATAAVLVVAVLAAHARVAHAGWIWDDDDHAANQTLRSLASLGRIWFDTTATPQYYPLVHTSYWLEYHLWGLRPLGYHLDNALLHAGSAILLLRILTRLRVPGATLAAAVFALHPVHVESVAWATERKNVLSGILALGSVLLYLRFAGIGEARPASRPPWRLYGAALALFVLAMLSKTTACAVPAALVLILWWKRDRLTTADLVRLVPMFVIGVVMGLHTAGLEKDQVGAKGPEWAFSFVDRCLIAGRALWFYAGKLAWPRPLMFIYPRWRIDAGAAWQYLYPGAFAAVVAALWALRRRIGKGPLVAVLVFAGTLVPALGFFDVYPMRFSFVADHFQYLASIGLIALFAAGVAKLVVLLTGGGGEAAPRATSAWSARDVALTAITAVVMVTLGFATAERTKAFEGHETLWRDTVNKNDTAWLAQYNLANTLKDQGKTEEAIGRYRKAVEYRSDYLIARINLGVTLNELGRYDEAAAEFREALKIKVGPTDPFYPKAHVGLGVALMHVGTTEEAIAEYEAALALNPRSESALVNLGNAFLKQGRYDEAIARYQQALAVNPQHGVARKQLAEATAKRAAAGGAVPPAP